MRLGDQAWLCTRAAVGPAPAGDWPGREAHRELECGAECCGEEPAQAVCQEALQQLGEVGPPSSHPHLSACLHSDTLDPPRSSGRFTPVSLRFHAPLVLDASHAVHALEHMVGGRPELRGRPSFPGSSRPCMTGTQAPAGWQLPAPFCGGMPSQWSPFPLSARASQAMDCRCAASLLAHITAHSHVSAEGHRLFLG